MGTSQYGDFGVHSRCGEYAGPVVIECADGQRHSADVKLTSFLLEGSGYSVNLHPRERLRLERPLLVTNDSQLRVVYHGNVKCEFDRQLREHIAPTTSGVRIIRGESWYGLLEYQTHGIFRRRKVFRLTAVGNKQAKVKDGETLYSYNLATMSGVLVQVQGRSGNEAAPD